jgi:orotate phosphoribosyltransferase
LNFRSVAQLSDQLLHWSHRLPADIEVVVGVPRSGLLAAALLALYLNVPLTDVDGLLRGRCFPAGTARRKRFAGGADGTSLVEFLHTPRTVLVVDDSLLSGSSMREVRERIEGAGLAHRVTYGAVYILPGKRDEVDYYCEVLNGPRIFEWNVLHGELLQRFCVALDGVLCRRPAAAEIGDGKHLYRAFMRKARPYLIPAVEIGWIVTERPEQYREETEAWLQAHGIRYRNLVMDDHPRRSHGSGAASAFKADVYRSTDASLFLEGSLRQAVEIGRLTGRHVLCTDSMQLVHPGSMPLPRLGTYGDLHPTRRPTLRQALKRLTWRALRTVLPTATVTAIRDRGARRN